MRTKRKKKKIGRIVSLTVLCILLLALLAGGAYIGLKVYKKNNAEPPLVVYEAAIEEFQPHSPESTWGNLLFAAEQSVRRIAPDKLIEANNKASMPVTVHYLDVHTLFEGIEEDLNAAMAQAASLSSRPSDVYDDQAQFKEELVSQAFDDILKERLQTPTTVSDALTVQFIFNGDAWVIENREELTALLTDSAISDCDTYMQDLYSQARESLEYIPIPYKIDENALAGSKPDPSLFGETTDPAVIVELLQSPLAKQLIGDQTLAWNADIAFLPDTSIYYYLDETILTLVWKEETSKAVGTFSEVIIADGSQLRRKIGGDQFESFDFNTTSGFADQTNAVLTFGGDFYHHSRSCGIVVYQRDIYRYDLTTCDNCYITADGDMLFSYRNQFENREQAQAFVKDNDVLFSLCFGPVLIDDGVDVTPDTYPWGEIQDNYARSALGMLGDKHYLTVNINCQQPNYYYLVTLRQAADAMIEKGCIKAYALDGGQTATTVFNGQLINPVQFGWEKLISDVIYFASAVPR